MLAKRLADLADAPRLPAALNLSRVARLEVDHRDVVAGIGEDDRDAAAHAARAETGDGGTGAHAESLRAAPLAARAGSRWPKPKRRERAPGLHEVLAADRAADGEERLDQRRLDAGELRRTTG